MIDFIQELFEKYTLVEVMDLLEIDWEVLDIPLRKVLEERRDDCLALLE